MSFGPDEDCPCTFDIVISLLRPGNLVAVVELAVHEPSISNHEENKHAESNNKVTEAIDAVDQSLADKGPTKTHTRLF